MKLSKLILFRFQSNYKSVLISPKTTTCEVVALVLLMSRIHTNPHDYHLFLIDDNAEAQIPDELIFAPIYLNLKSQQKIAIRK